MSPISIHFTSRCVFTDLDSTSRVQRVVYRKLVGVQARTDQFQGESGDSEFVYDTGSGVLTTTSVDCISGCETSYYDQSRSTTAVTISANDSVLRYGSATLQGKYVQDTTCVAA